MIKYKSKIIFMAFFLLVIFSFYRFWHPYFKDLKYLFICFIFYSFLTFFVSCFKFNFFNFFSISLYSFLCSFLSCSFYWFFESRQGFLGELSRVGFRGVFDHLIFTGISSLSYVFYVVLFFVFPWSFFEANDPEKTVDQ